MQVSSEYLTIEIQLIQLLCENSGLESLATYRVRPTQKIQDQTNDDLVAGLFDQTADNITFVWQKNCDSLKKQKHYLVHTICLR